MHRDRRLLTTHLESLRCLDEGDGWGRSEPYLWTVSLTIGGDELRQDPDNIFRLLGEPIYAFGRGSHGNLGHRGWTAGDHRAIPPAVGAFGAMVRPIALDVLGQRLELPGIAAVVAVLMEEDNVSDAGAEAGHRAFNDLIRSRVNAFIAGLDLLELHIAAGQLAGELGLAREDAVIELIRRRFAALKEELVDASDSVVRQAIVGAQGALGNLWSAINGDDLVGTMMLVTTTAELVAAGRERRFTHRLHDPDSDGDYELSGRFVLTPPYIPFGVIPEGDRLEISAVARRYSRRRGFHYITHVGGSSDGEPWILRKHDAAVLERDGLRDFFVRGADGSETEISASVHERTGNLYIHTHPNETTEDNLLSLPALSFYYPEPEPEPEPA